jgi:hypothetical protein
LNAGLAVVEPVLEALRMEEARAEALTQSALELLAGVEGAMRDVRRKVAKIAYPWGHVEREMSLAEYLVPEVPPAGEWDRLREMGHETRRRYLDAHRRLLAELAALAESVEEAAGLPRLSPLRQGLVPHAASKASR